MMMMLKTLATDTKQSIEKLRNIKNAYFDDTGLGLLDPKFDLDLENGA